MIRIEPWKRWLIWLTVAIGVVLALPNVFYGRVEQANDARLLMEREGVATPALEGDAALWPDFLPSGLVNLGLDLRGGAHLLAEVRLEDVYETRLDGLWPELRDLLREARAEVGPIRRIDEGGDALRIRIAEEAGMARAVAIARSLARPVASLTGGAARDIEVTGAGDVLTITLSEAERQAVDEQTMRQTVEIIRRRVDEVGTREPTIQRQGERRVLIQVPGLGSAEELRQLIGTTAQLTFHPVLRRTTDTDVRPGPRELFLPSADPRQEGFFYLLEATPVVTGEQLTNAQPAFDQNGEPAVSFQFNPAGARIFGDYTLENIGQLFAIVLDEEVVSAPEIISHIPGGSGIITGRFTVEETTNLAVLLRAGALPAELDFVEERTVGPELGQDSIDAGRIATVVAFAFVLVFMALAYGLFGLFANVALILNIALLFGLLSLVGATLTLPGIAGIVLTVGMAVDANVLVFERIREELKTAKGPARAIELGYEKALSAIVDANVTTFITAVILFAMGSGPVRGFAITLGFGIVTSVFTAIYVTRLLIVTWFERRRPRTIEV
ncbi:preprotein translocase subunit SecD [Hasllibacter halocynthiae]|uniref:Protein translocase subunit SecD n=1 Tax=Hasllibacter halocynthiae TaxID=595589 RepID=A0A2T0X8Y5_9RHOB|nr:protein translocase subunit SecD [Hasllibacter halocynthiae]PRY95411.1 preprotein translocase subunit SecD [Hasllibacter halocynthiae]